MKKAALIFFSASIVLGIFGYWGQYTKAGQEKFDEMAGMIPEFAAFLSLIFFLVAAIFSVMVFLKRK